MITKTFTCKVCGKEFESCGTVVYYCPDCRTNVKYEYKRENKKKKKAHGLRCKNLDEFMHELAMVNKEREKAGLKPLTYGQYTVCLRQGDVLC